MTDKFKETFKEESFESLEELEQLLLALEQSPGDKETVSHIFRIFHTIKGSAAMFGFDRIAAFTHKVETLLEKVRDDKVGVSKELIDTVLDARDEIQEMIRSSDSGTAEPSKRALSVLERVGIYLKEPPTPEVKPEPKETLSSSTTGSKKTYRILFRLRGDVMCLGVKPHLLLQELKNLGEYECVTHTDKVPPFSKFDPEQCYLGWDVILTTEADINAIRDVFIFVEDRAEIRIEEAEDYRFAEAGPYEKKVGQILLERGAAKPDSISKALKAQRRIGEVLLERKEVSPASVKAALMEQEHIREKQREKREEFEASTLRIKSERLDTIINIVGELVTVHAQLSRAVKLNGDKQIVSIVEQIGRLTSELRNNTMGIRMLPIGSAFNKFQRLVRDLSAELGKEVDLVFRGADTELDKTVIEKLNDPLIHLVRNSIDHGIETPEQRKKKGKPERGTLTLSAVHSGAFVHVIIEDDGKGIDVDAVREKAVEKGLISQDAKLTTAEIQNLIFEPGFSTAANVTNVSGRGVGMDVVKKNIDALGGFVQLDNRHERGLSIVLKIPLTLAIIDGFLVRAGTEIYAIPLVSVEKCVELTASLRSTIAPNSSFVNIGGDIIPFVRMRTFFEIEGDAPSIEELVVVKAFDSRLGLIVDQILGGYQTVIKSFGDIGRDVEGVSGATILGDGTVALILDPARLAAAVQWTDAAGA